MYYDQGALPVPGRPKMPAYQQPVIQNPPQQRVGVMPKMQTRINGSRTPYTAPQQSWNPYAQPQEQQPYQQPMMRPRYSQMPSGPRRLQLPQGAMGFRQRKQMYSRGMNGRPPGAWDYQPQPQPSYSPPMMDWY